MNVRNIIATSGIAIDCEIEHPIYGWIPFTAHPDDCVEMGRTVYAEIIAGTHGPIGAYVAPVVTREEVDGARKAAYSDSFTGSDRLFAEAQRMQLMGETGWEAVRDQAVARFEEIKSQHPWPAE